MDIKRLLVLAGRPLLTEGSLPPWLKDDGKKDDKKSSKKLPWEKNDDKDTEDSEEKVEEEWEKPWEKDDDSDEKVEDEKVEEDSPAGWEGTVKGMKKHREIDNPWALSHYMKNKGYHSHMTKSGKKK